MKKIVFAAIVISGLAGSAGASIIYSSPCSVLQSPDSGPTLSGVCSATADPGFYISSVTLTITSDYTGWQSGNPVVTNTYTFATNTAGFGTIPDGVVTTSGTNSSSIQNFDVTLFGNFGPSVSESFNMSNAVTGGTVTGSSGVMTITATETASAVPEPATSSFVGGVLLGLCIFSTGRQGNRHRILRFLRRIPSQP